MYALDHAPPHFHVEYGGYESLVEIESLALTRGLLPSGARKLVIKWASLHQIELLQAWNRARRLESPGRIAPLK